MSNRINLGQVIGATGQAGQDGQRGERGEPGDTPYISGGYWWIGTTNTGVVAKGNEWFYGESVPTSQGVNGDLYLRSNGDVYKKESGVWVLKTSIKGAQGIQGERGESALTFEVGSVTTGDTPSVTNSGTEEDIVLDFVLPKGVKGDKGEKGDTTVTVGGFVASTIAFDSDPQGQIDSKLGNNMGSQNAGKLLQVGVDGLIVPASSSAEDDVIDAYIVGQQYSSNWLSETPNGEALIPATGKLYVIRTAGDYFMNVYAWNNPSYIKTSGSATIDDGAVTYAKLSSGVQELIEGKLDASDLEEVSNQEVDDLFD